MTDETSRPSRQASRAPTRMSEPRWEAGMVLGGVYELGRILGAGGMGIVREARDLELRRTVAVKLPSTPEAEELLLDEARSLAVLDHPGIPSVHGVGTHEGTRFMVMERVVGMTLEDHLHARWDRGQGMSIREVLDLALELSEILREVHRAGLAHRDVKPENVILARRGAVLLDLGIARPEYMGADDLVAGTPEYLAPEAIDLSAERGHLLDIYGLGAMLFELLTGRLPFEAPTTSTLLFRHLTAPVPDPRALRPEIPPRLAALVRSMMAKEPHERPEDMEVVVWRLREIAGRVDPPKVTQQRPVLVVDDDPDIHILIETFFAEWAPGLSVIAAMSAEEAIERMAETSPSFVLLDLKLPGMSGMELSMYLSSTRASVDYPIVAMSAGAAAADVALWKQLGVSHFVAKGEQFEEKLGAIVRAWWESHRGLSMPPGLRSDG